MWGAPEEPPDTMEGPGPSESGAIDASISAKDICEDNKSQLETFKDIMLKNKNDLKKKEEELQEYASKLSEIKSRAKRSRRSKDAASSSSESVRTKIDSSTVEVTEDTVDDISQAKTPKAKSSLLQRKLAENRKIFERRSKEMTENKRAVEEKVEAIRQQMDQTDLTLVEAQKEQLAVTPVRPVLVTPQLISPPILHVGQDKDNKIAELSNKILELEATIIDLQENLREKDSVIDSKTKAVTLMSADLSKKGKTTLDTLEDTKDEMRSMQENFVLIESSLRGKNENLLEQLQNRNDRVTELEDTIIRYEQEMEEKRLAETASASLSRSTMDTLADTKEAMKSMQENFVLIETSLKDKIENLLGQLQDRETKLAESVDKIYKLESGAGIVTPPEIPDLQYKIDRLEQSNRALQDEKYELQKSIAELQEKIVARESSNGNGLIVEKDNRIAELENLIEELKSSNQLLEEESKAELQKQVVELAAKNEEFRGKIDELERLNNDLEIEKNELRSKLPDDSGSTKEDAMVRKLTKELDDLNKSMIKLKAQHKSKLRNLQKQLESFKSVSDANAELVKLGNQVALLEEEKGNLQLSLVDFDELKASAGDWQDRIADLESRVVTQTNDIQSHIEAIAILENQKLDLMQELHTVKQEISALEAETAESENLRVTAEMKVVDLEEQLEALHKSRNTSDESSQSTVEFDREDLLRKIEHLTHENSELVQRITKLEEKPSSEAGSTESFETIHEDRNEMLKKIEALTSRNHELEEKLAKLEEAARSNVGSTESFETINDTDKTELVKKIDLLERENNDLVTKLNKYEEKGSSDTGSTESFEKIPEQIDNLTRIEFLTRENNELVIKLTKLEEKFADLDSRQIIEPPSSEESSELEAKLQTLIIENSDLVIELTKVQEKLARVADDKFLLEKRLEESRNAFDVEIERHEEIRSRLEALTSENNELIIKLVKLEEKNAVLSENSQKVVEAEAVCQRTLVKEVEICSDANVTVASLENEIEQCRKLISEQTEMIDEMRQKLAEKETELETKVRQISEHEESGKSIEELQQELKESFGVIDEWKFKCTEMERKMEILEAGKISIEEGLKLLQEENKALIEQSKQKDDTANALKQELDSTITTFESRLNEERSLIAKQEEEIDTLRTSLNSKDEELHKKYMALQNEMIMIDGLQDQLNTSMNQLQQSEATIASLNDEIRRLSDLAIVSTEETASARAEIAALREELSTKADKEARNEELSRLLSDKESIAEEMKTILNEQLKENANLRNSTENLNAEIAKLRELLAERENEVASIAEAKFLIEENLRESTMARADAEARLESLQNNLDDNVRYTDGLKAELSDAYRMLELLKAKHTEDIDMQNRRLEDLIEDLNAKSAELEILRLELVEKTNLIQELESKTSELETLRSELIEKSSLIKDFEVKASELEILRVQLTEKEKLVGQNVTEQVKIALELRVTELEQQLEEAAANTQAQLQKRKILAANLKKKSFEAAELEARTGQLEQQIAELEPKLMEYETKMSTLEPRAAELEAKTLELEEKWITEKSEKDAANLRIQEIETIIQNRNEALLQLETQLQRSRNETAVATNRVEELTSELENSSEKLNILMEQVNEMGEEIEKLRIALDVRTSELDAEKHENQRLITEHESIRVRIAEEEKQKQQILEEIERLREALELRSSELESEKNETQRLTAEQESGKIKIIEEETQRQQVLEEAKEKARELGVRMQVMEAEYVEQLNTIQTLRTENGMLLSKQAQINERLENAEKESAEQKILLDQYQRETVGRETENLDRQETAPPDAEGDRLDIEGKDSSTQPCDQCDQCQTVVQALEAKLQERDAEIENLDNELANSIGNFVHMRESLRVSDLMNQSNSRNRSLEDSRENSDLVYQYNALTASNTELRDQLNATLQENQDLNEKIASLQELNVALQERTEAVENELIAGREATTRLHAADVLHTELLEKCEQRENELSGARSEIEVMKQRHEEWMAEMRSRVEQFEVENVELTKKCDELTEMKNIAEDEIASLRTDADICRQRIQELQIDVEKYKQESVKLIEENSKRDEKPASSFFQEKKDDSPQLFDAAKVFGLPADVSDTERRKELDELRNIVAMKDQEILKLVNQTESLQAHVQQMNDRRLDDLEIARANCQRLENDLARVELILEERNREIDSLNSELNNVGVLLSAQCYQEGNNAMLESSIAKLKLEHDEQTAKLTDAGAAVENLTIGNTRLVEELESLRLENDRLSGTIDIVLSAMTNLAELDNEKISELSLISVTPTIHVKLVEILNSLAALKDERNVLSAAQESFKQRIAFLEGEIQNSNDATRIQELEERVDKIVRERDIKQLQVNDLTRSLEEMQESMEKASSNEEIRLRNLQEALDQALGEHDRLKVQLENLTTEHSQKIVESAEAQHAQTSQSSETRKSEAEVEMGWDDETKLEADEEIWSWNPEDVENHGHLAAPPLPPNLEITLKARIAELEDTVNDLEAEKDKLNEELKATQVRSGKLVKKLKEFKIQNDSLQQQLKIQKASDGFCDLDSAIEEELKSQIATLEKSLNEAKEEHKKTIVERENFAKRIEVLSAANERLVEMKERQDMDVEVLQIRTKDLTTKLQALEWQFKEACGSDAEIPIAPVAETKVEARQVESLQSTGATSSGYECLCKKYREEIDELRDEMEALAAENEQLQKLLEEHKNTRLSTESKLSNELTERAREIEELKLKNTELEKNLEDSITNYQTLKNEYEQTVKTNAEQTALIKGSHEVLKQEIAEKTSIFETEVKNMSQQIDSAAAQINLLQENLQTLVREKEELIERTTSYEETREKLLSLTDAMADVTDLLNARVQEVAELKQEMQKLKADKNEALDTVEGLAQNHSRVLIEQQHETQQYIRNCEQQLNDRATEIRTLTERLYQAETERDTSFVNVQNLREEIERLNNALAESRSHRESLQSELASKEQELFRDEDQVRDYANEINRLNEVIAQMQKSSANAIEDATRKIHEIEEREASLKKTIAELSARESEALAQMYREISEKDGQVANLQQTVSNLEQKIYEVAGNRAAEKGVDVPETVDGLPVCKMSMDDLPELRTAVEELRDELNRKEQEIEDYKYQLSESTYPSIIQALQDQVNTLYEEKARLEQSLATATNNLYTEQQQREELIESLRQQNQHQTELEKQVDELTSIVGESEDKDIGIRKLTIELEEKETRYRELKERHEATVAEINELRSSLASKDQEIAMLRDQLESTSNECEFLQQAMKAQKSSTPTEDLQRSETSTTTATATTIDDGMKEQLSNELDVAMYMLHQRDVRCEELTHELMQLLEERDTLQLRLSNAIRINEELRRSLPADAHTSESLQGIADVEPVVEQPSPSRSVGPVEIAKEAIDSPSEEKIALAEKLSQLHNMGHRRDVRLMDDRDTRHNQQMSLLAHRDVLSTLPPEAAARIVNANYTLSRDVQSQSSVLMNWLWGKSTPKVVHM